MAEVVHIGEVAKLVGTSVDTIRFYQKLGLSRVQVAARADIACSTERTFRISHLFRHSSAM